MKGYVLQKYLNCKTRAKKESKRIFQNWNFPSLFYLLNFIFSEFCDSFIKNRQSYKEKLFSADIKIFTIVSVFEHVLSEFSKHMEAFIVASTQVYWQRKNQSLEVL